MTTMTSLANAYNAYMAYRNAKGAEIHNLTESQRRILRTLKDLGVIFKA